MGIISEQPVLSRLDRLDNMVRTTSSSVLIWFFMLSHVRLIFDVYSFVFFSYQLRELEEMRGCNKFYSPRSSCPSTPSSETFNSEGHQSSVDLSPTRRSLEKHCRPIDHVMVETLVKGTLVERLDQAEDRLLKV